MRKWLLLVVCILLSGCSTKEVIVESQSAEYTEDKTEVTLAMYPVGNLGSVSAFSEIVSEFNQSQKDIVVNVEYLSYVDGDSRIEDMINEGAHLDMVFEGPERIVANWGRRGLMLPIGDMLEVSSGCVNESVRDACKEGNDCYMLPVCTTAHCMAVNKDMLEEVGALQYIDPEKRTWTTTDFLKTVELLNMVGKSSLSVYCTSQAGDQGTRALITNMHGGRYANEEHTGYEVSSVENEQALSELYDAEGVVFGKNEDGATALSKFCLGEYAMTACWNVSQEISQAFTVQFDIYPVSFPTEDGSPARLDGGVWGFGVFKSDNERQEACKEFIKYVVTNPSTYRKVVTLSTFWPALITSEDLYENDVLMQEYGLFTDYMGDYYQVTTNWSKARTAWWQMLQKVGDGENIDECMAWFQQEVE